MKNLSRRLVRSLLSCAVCLGLMGCQEEAILHELSEVQANRVIVALDRVGILAEKRHEGQTWSIFTAAAQTTSALAALEESRVLRNELNSNTVGTSSALVQSREERMQFVERQLASSLEATLETLPDVLQARVHLFLDPGEKLALLRSSPKQTASVLIISDHSEAIDRSQIQKLVSGASGVEAEQVIVLISLSKDTPDKQPIVQSRQSDNEVLAVKPGQKVVSTLSNKRAAALANYNLVIVVAVVGFVMGAIGVLIRRWHRRTKNRRRRLHPPSLVPESGAAEVNNSLELGAAPFLSDGKGLGVSTSLNGASAESNEGIF